VLFCPTSSLTKQRKHYVKGLNPSDKILCQGKALWSAGKRKHKIVQGNNQLYFLSFWRGSLTNSWKQVAISNVPGLLPSGLLLSFWAIHLEKPQLINFICFNNGFSTVPWSFYSECYCCQLNKLLFRSLKFGQVLRILKIVYGLQLFGQNDFWGGGATVYFFNPKFSKLQICPKTAYNL